MIIIPEPSKSLAFSQDLQAYLKLAVEGSNYAIIVVITRRGVPVTEIGFSELVTPNVYNPRDREMSDDKIRAWIDKRLQVTYQVSKFSEEGTILFEAELLGGKDSYFASTTEDYRSFDPTDFVGKDAETLAEMFP